MKKLISSFLLATAIVAAPMAFANNQHTYLAMINNSSFKTKVQEGLAYKSTWLLEPGESKDSWYIFTSIYNLKFSYQKPGSDTWYPMSGCSSRWWYDHSVTVSFENFKNGEIIYPVCRIRIH